MIKQIKIFLLFIITTSAQTVIDVDLYRIAEDMVDGPEAIAFDDEGKMYTANEDGRIIVLSRDGTDPYDFAQTEGRPLGLKFDLQGNLIVADAYEGLLSIDTTGEITILSTECDSLPFLITDDLDISSDGIIYFSDASSVNNLENNGDDWGEPNGRLLAYDPQTNETSLLLDGLYFANGVALAPDESYVLVNESSLGRVRRYWLAGPNTGETEVFSYIYGNIGWEGWVLPDNITYNDEGIFWVATYFGPVVGIDTSGQIVYELNFDFNLFGENTSVIQYNDSLYLGTLHDSFIGVIPLPEELLSDRNVPQLVISEYQLNQNFPNPFNPITTVRYELPKDSFVDVTIYDMLGNVVNNLVNNNQSHGYKSIQWDATNNQGEPVSAGVYLYRIQASDFVDTKRMILLK